MRYQTKTKTFCRYCNYFYLPIHVNFPQSLEEYFANNRNIFYSFLYFTQVGGAFGDVPLFEDLREDETHQALVIPVPVPEDGWPDLSAIRDASTSMDPNLILQLDDTASGEVSLTTRYSMYYYCKFYNRRAAIPHQSCLRV